MAVLVSAALLIPAAGQIDLTPVVPVPPGVPDFPGPPAPEKAPGSFTPQLEADEGSYVKRSMAELEQLVAPVALYPDELLAQVLPSATSPLDVVKAHQFILQNPDMKEPPADALRNWDPAVVSLMQFRDVIKLMAEDIAWTTALGEAVYFQEQDVYDAIQRVRAKADSKGMLVNDDKQIHVRESGIIRIEPSDPQVIYVPQYDPQVIYVEQPVVVYEPAPLVTYHTGVNLLWGLSWAFDWSNRRCIHHHHWAHSWHHHRYHHKYASIYHHGGKSRAIGSVCPPGGRPPRPSGWRAPDQRPHGWTPPRPTHGGAGRPGSRSGALSHAGNVWRPGHPMRGRNPDSRSPGRAPTLAGGGRSTTGPPATTRHGTTTTRPGSRPGSLRTTQPGRSSSLATLPSGRSGTSTSRLNLPSRGSTTSGTRSMSIQPRPGSRIGNSTRSSAITPRTLSSPARSISPSLSRSILRANPSAGRSTTARVSPPASRSTYQPSRSIARPSSTRVAPTPSRSTYQPSRSVTRSSSTRVAPTRSRSTYQPSRSVNRSSSTRAAPTRSRPTYQPNRSASRSPSTRAAPRTPPARPSIRNAPSSSSRSARRRR